MPMPYKGRRVTLTSRVPVDVGRRAAAAAEAKRWTMSAYVGWAVERALDHEVRARAQRNHPLHASVIPTDTQWPDH